MTSKLVIVLENAFSVLYIRWDERQLFTLNLKFTQIRESRCAGTDPFDKAIQG